MRWPNPNLPANSATEILEHALEAVRTSIDHENRLDHRRRWLLLSLVVAAVRGILADHLITDPQGFRAINDEEFGEWIMRHGGHPDVLEFTAGARPVRLGVRLRGRRPGQARGGGGRDDASSSGSCLFGYKGAIFWKMTAGMGDVVIAPLYQALRRRGVEFEFFHRLDALHLDARHHAIDAITMGRQVALADGVDHYEPLTTVRGLPVFPDRAAGGTDSSTEHGLDGLESHFGTRR